MARGSSKSASTPRSRAREVKPELLRDTVVASVCWNEDQLFYIVLVRRRDAALAFLDVPPELAFEFGHFNVEAVVANAEALRRIVAVALPYAQFKHDAEVGDTPVRDGETPARLGAVRHFRGGGAFGVDIGEFELLQPPPWLM